MPEPMLASSGQLPASAGYLFEVKWDGFRAIVSTEGAQVCAAAAAGT
jgi:ATP-dependent DNA ligase